jgi:hypothetical protein
MAAITKVDLEKLFSRIDARLKKNIEIYIIGGAAAILGYNVMKETNDVDLDGRIDSEFQKLFDEEVKSLKLVLHLSSSGVFTPPDGYRERTKFEDFPKKKLRVRYLDQYDLAISKIDRGLEKDYEDIRRIHQKSPFDRERLIEIFNNEYIRVSSLGNPRIKMMNLLDVIATLFGGEYVEDSKIKIGFK